MEICTDNRFELIEKYKKELLESTNIEDSQDEMNVIDNVLFRFWQIGWLDGLENVNRLLNDCNTYKIRWAKASRTARAEAIKEFAERLKDAFPEGNRDAKCPAIYYDDYCEIIDNFAEEMTEEKK